MISETEINKLKSLKNLAKINSNLLRIILSIIIMADDVIYSWKEQYLIKKNIIYRKNHVKNSMESEIDFR